MYDKKTGQTGDEMCRFRRTLNDCCEALSNGTIKFWCFVAQDDMRGLQVAFTKGGSFFLHGLKPRIKNGLGD